MFRLFELLCLCCVSMLVATEYYGDNGGYPGGVPGAGLHPGDSVYRGRGSNGLGLQDAYQYCVPSAEDPDADCVPGEAGLNYPVYSQIPITGFACQNQPYPGYYADQETQCQVFHICQHDGRHDSFLCPNGSIFNQQYFACDWWYNIDCATASSFYDINAELYQEPGFYGGSYSPVHRGHHQAGKALHNGYGSPRAPLSPLENGRNSNGYPASFSSAYGPDPLHKARLLLSGSTTSAKGY